MELFQLSFVKNSSRGFPSAIFKKNSTGFTLIELMLYVGLASILLMSTSLFLSVLLTSRVKNQTIAEVEGQGIQVMQIITQTLRNADSVNLPLPGATLSSLNLITYTGSLNPTIFDLSSGVIRITEGAGAPVALTNTRVSVSSLTFQNLSRLNTPYTIRIQFTLSYINSIGRNEYNYSKTFIGSASLRQP